MLHQSPESCDETAKEMLEKIYLHAQEIKYYKLSQESLSKFYFDTQDAILGMEDD